MTGFRSLLAALFLAVGAYTAIVMVAHGPNLFPAFFGDMAAMGWPGQFNFDFMAMLALSGSWIAWRHHFTPTGLLLGVGGFFLGAPFLTAYLLWWSRDAEQVADVLARLPSRTP